MLERCFINKLLFVKSCKGSAINIPNKSHHLMFEKWSPHLLEKQLKDFKKREKKKHVSVVWQGYGGALLKDESRPLKRNSTRVYK